MSQVFEHLGLVIFNAAKGTQDTANTRKGKRRTDLRRMLIPLLDPDILQARAQKNAVDSVDTTEAYISPRATTLPSAQIEEHCSTVTSTSKSSGEVTSTPTSGHGQQDATCRFRARVRPFTAVYFVNTFLNQAKRELILLSKPQRRSTTEPRCRTARH